MIVHNGCYALTWVGDCRGSLAQMAAAGVRAQTCVTSPPYFGLRDYGHEGQIGLEPSPDEYVAAMVDVFRGVREVLAGYAGEHDALGLLGWQSVAWKARGGYGSQGEGAGRENAARERLWLSPACLPVNEGVAA